MGLTYEYDKDIRDIKNMKTENIKYRAWDKPNKRMLYFSGLSWHEEYDLLYFTDGRLDVPARDNLVFMRCTGIKDTHGNDIYEGDVINHTNCGFYIIEYVKKYAKFDAIPISNKANELDIEWFESKHTEVIGNIYENPKLLEEKKDE